MQFVLVFDLREELDDSISSFPSMPPVKCEIDFGHMVLEFKKFSF